MYCLLRPCVQKSLKLLSKVRLRYIFAGIGIVMFMDYFGAFTHLFEIPYDANFVYPYEGDVQEFINALRHKEKPSVNPINDWNYTYILDNKQKCTEAGYKNFRIVYVIKSAIENSERRSAIRNSWGFEKRFFDIPSRTVFLLGIHQNDDELQAKIKMEAAKYRDIIQINFTDSYYNNTLKTMMGFKWIVKYCLNSKFYMFVDDDIYVSVKNVLRFIRNPANYPDYLKEPKKFGAHKREITKNELNTESQLSSKNVQKNILVNTDKIDFFNLYRKQNMEEYNRAYIEKLNNSTETENLVPNRINDTPVNTLRNQKSLLENFEYNISKSELKRMKRQIFDFELPEDVRLFAGFVFISSPHRHKSSKWYVSLKEYPYHLWPPYVTAGAYILSKEALVDIYYTSLYTKFFKFDDIFLSLVAKKANIEPFHCEEFHFYKKDYTKYNYKYVITSHGYGNPSELLYVWNEQKALGNA